MDAEKFIRNTIVLCGDYFGKGEIRNAYRCLGAIEAALIFEGVLEAGKPLKYREIDEGYIPRWFRLVRRKRTETYKELILRLAKEYLEMKPISDLAIAMAGANIEARATSKG